MLNWIPFKIFKQDDQWRAQWLYLGDHLFKSPFFEETLAACRGLPYNSSAMKVVTGLESLPLASQYVESIPPTAFIFHISRCGSTLMSQLLSLKDENIVVSEPPLFDQILRLKYQDPTIPDAERLGYAHHAVHIMGQKRFANLQYYFLKCDCWHLFFLDEIRRLYPHVPFLFMTRNLEDIILSHQKKPGMQSVPGLLEPAIYGYTMPEVLDMGAGQYLKNILQKMWDISHDYANKDANSMLLEYEDGVLDNYYTAMRFLKLESSQLDAEKAIARLKYHSKEPKNLFQQKV